MSNFNEVKEANVDVEEEVAVQVESEDEDDSVKDIHFDDSEEERDLGEDDGFPAGFHDVIHIVPPNFDFEPEQLEGLEQHEECEEAHVEDQQEFDQLEEGTTRVTMATKNRRSRIEVDMTGIGCSQPQTETFIPENAEQLFADEDDVSSEELHSEEYDSDDELGLTSGKNKKFKQEDMRKEFKFKIGMEFTSLKQFKDAILEHSVLNGRQVKFVKNDKTRVRVVCSRPCPFKALVSQVGRSQTFAIKTLIQPHTCGRVFDNKNATSKWVAKTLVDKFRSNQDLTLNNMIDDIRRSYSTGITVFRAFKAKQLAKKVVEGDAAKQYSLLWNYSAELRKACPFNTCKLNLERPSPMLQPRFGSFYVCLDGCKRGFVQGCRPFIGVDGCHLKNKYGGQFLIAVGRDPNDQYFPLAFGVVEVENKETWRWFLTLLLEDIGDINSNRWVFISDQQKGLIQVFEELLEGVEHRFCLRHLYANFKKRFGGGTLIRDLMMGAAKATYVESFEEKMKQINDINPQAHEWLRAIPTKSWCKHSFSFYPRCDVLMNNLSEAFNSTILLAREKPIITMLEWIREYLMGRFSNNREKLSKYEGEVMPKPRRRLDKEIEHSGNWIPTWAGQQKYEVKHTMLGGQYIVNLATTDCSCNFWGLVGIPCRHVVAAISYKGDEPENYVHEYYKRAAYDRTYSPEISAINGPKKWPNTDHEEILPPSYKRGPGRPKKLRRREPDEPDNSERMKRSDSHNRCAKCHQYGHNVRTCKNPAVPGYVPRVPKKKQTDPASESSAQTEALAGSEPAAPPQATPTSEPATQTQPTAETAPNMKRRLVTGISKKTGTANASQIGTKEQVPLVNEELPTSEPGTHTEPVPTSQNEHLTSEPKKRRRLVRGFSKQTGLQHLHTGETVAQTLHRYMNTKEGSQSQVGMNTRGEDGGSMNTKGEDGAAEQNPTQASRNMN